MKRVMGKFLAINFRFHFFYRVGHILNVTKEVDNFFPGLFHYIKVRVTDEESTELMKHWDITYKFIYEAK